MKRKKLHVYQEDVPVDPPMAETCQDVLGVFTEEIKWIQLR